MNIKVQRIYDLKKPASQNVFLVDRLWPRGVKKEILGKGTWWKEAAPSNELRTWFHEDSENRYAEFKKRYLQELKENKSLILGNIELPSSVTLLTASKDIELSHIPVLMKFLERLP